jgi:hypothetical protein
MLQKNNKYENPVDSIAQFLTPSQDSQAVEKPDDSLNITERKLIPIQNRPKTDKEGRVLKRKRLNLVILPSLVEDIKKIAYVENIAINEAVNRALELYRDTHKDILAKYAEIEKLKTSNKDNITQGP